MIIDFHTHVGEDIGDEDLQSMDFERLKKSMDKWGVDKSVVFPINCHGSLIEDSLEILERSKTEDWIIPFLRIDPKEMSKDELGGLLDRGFRGLKLHSRSQDFNIDDEDYFWIYEICDKKGLPVLFHCSMKESQSHPDRIFRVAEKFSGLKIVMAHMFGGSSIFAKEAVKYPNLYADTSINLGSLPQKIAVEKYGFKRLLFGSDIPYDSQGVAILKVKEAGLSKEDEDLILGGNAMRVLGLTEEIVVKQKEMVEGDRE
jgi:predicted TIM-barrel fold metal-dependent hydrolase